MLQGRALNTEFSLDDPRVVYAADKTGAVTFRGGHPLTGEHEDLLLRANAGFTLKGDPAPKHGSRAVPAGAVAAKQSLTALGGVTNSTHLFSPGELAQLRRAYDEMPTHTIRRLLRNVEAVELALANLNAKYQEEVVARASLEASEASRIASEAPIETIDNPQGEMTELSSNAPEISDEDALQSLLTSLVDTHTKAVLVDIAEELELDFDKSERKAEVGSVLARAMLASDDLRVRADGLLSAAVLAE